VFWTNYCEVVSFASINISTDTEITNGVSYSGLTLTNRVFPGTQLALEHKTC